MKKRISLCEILASCFLILLATTILDSCKKKTTVIVTSEQNKETVSEKKRTLRAEIVIYGDKDGNNTPLYTEDKDGNMVLADYAIPGDVIEAYESLENSEDLEEKEAARLLSNGKAETLDFVHVRYYGKDYWVRPIYITNQKDLCGAYVTEDTLIYETTDLENSRTTEIEKGTFVAGSKYSIIDGTFYAKIFYYDWKTPYGKEGYIKKDAIKDEKKNVYAAQVDRSFANTKDLNTFVRDEVSELLETYN